MPARSFRHHLPLLLALGVAACGPSNMVSVKAEIASIERQCSFHTAVRTSTGTIPINPGEMKPCDTTDEFDALRGDPAKRTKDIVGKGTLTVSFTPPGKDETQTAEIAIDGHDDVFYARRGDTISVRVDKTDPTKVRL